MIIIPGAAVFPMGKAASLFPGCRKHPARLPAWLPCTVVPAYEILKDGR